MAKPTTKKVIPLPTTAPEQTAGAKAPEASAPQVFILPLDHFQAAKEWAYRNLKANEFDALMSHFKSGQAGSFKPQDSK